MKYQFVVPMLYPKMLIFVVKIKFFNENVVPKLRNLDYGIGKSCT